MPQATASFTFSVIAEDACSTMHEPSALPGGYVFVPAALFLAAQDEAEFAGMLAHAMAHIAERQAMGSEQISVKSAPLIFVGGWTGSCTEAVALPMGFVATQRRFEQQADILALQPMTQAGFDPNALVRFVERVQQAPPATGSSEFSAIPPRDQRVAAMISIIEGPAVTKFPSPAEGDYAVAREQVRRVMPLNTTAPPSLGHRMPQ